MVGPHASSHVPSRPDTVQVLFKRKPVQYLQNHSILEPSPEYRDADVSALPADTRRSATDRLSSQIWLIKQTGEFFFDYEAYSQR